MKLKSLLNELLTEVSIDMLRKHFVDTEKITPEDFEEIVKVTKGNPTRSAWLCKKVEERIIHPEDLYKFEEYLSFYDKYQRFFKEKDLTRIKTAADYKDWFNQLVDIRTRLSRDSSEEGENTEKYVSKEGIEELRRAGVKYLGMDQGFQVFEVPKGSGENTYKAYRKWLFKCSIGNELTNIDICTFRPDHFKSYTEKGPLFLLYNLGDENSPYQLHYESNEFRDRANRSIPV